MDPPSSCSLQSAAYHHENSITAVDIITKKIKGKKKQLYKDGAASVASSSSSASTSSSGFSVRGATRVACKRRGPKAIVNAARRNPNSDEIGFRLGMSIAVSVNQILERNGVLGGRMSSDHLAKICGLAVRESLSNDFGNTFDCFIQNFEQSFGSTLRTLKSIKEVSEGNTEYISRKEHREEYSPRVDEQVDCLREGCRSSSTTENDHSKEVTHSTATEGPLSYRDQLHQHMLTDPVNLEVALHCQTNQLTCFSSRTVEPVTNQSMLDTFKKSVVEQTRANDLKMFELGLTMKDLSLKEEQVALGYDSNLLERSKIAMGRSKASFKAEKFKTELEDTRHSELHRKCIDCLVTGLFIMVAALSYGTYVHSYRRITEATASCTPSKDSTSWWNPMASFSSGYQVLRCQAEVVSRMAFGFFMIVAIAYLILQRSGSKQTMPVTFIVLLLGIACGWAGKFCVDTLGGKGNHWLIYWETLCLVHLFCNVFTSALFHILHGPVDVSRGTKGNSIFPYWIRRLVFYSIMFLFLPLVCGLLPFASLGEWKHHFLLLVADVDYWVERGIF